MIKTYFALTFVLVFSLMSCGTEEPMKDKDTPPMNEPDVIPEWDKTKTAKVYLISKFDETSLSNDIYDQITQFLKKNKFQVAILNRSDIDLSTTFNGGVKVTSDLKLYSTYNLLGFEKNKIKGSTIIVNNSIEKQKTFFVDNNCSINNTETYATKKIPFPLTVSSFSSQEQISLAKKSISHIVSGNRVLVLTIKSSLLESIKKIVLDQNSSYRIKETKANGEFSTVVVSPKYWLVRESEKVKDLSDGSEIYLLQIEANVF